MTKKPWAEAGAGNKNERELTTAGAASKEGESEKLWKTFLR